MKYIFFLESLVSMKMFDTELQVYLNRWFFFYWNWLRKRVWVTKGTLCPLFIFIYCTEGTFMLNTQFISYLLCKTFLTSVVHSGLEIFYIRTAFDITSRVLPSMTNATQWILSARLGCFIYPGVSDSKGTKGLNYNIKYV